MYTLNQKYWIRFIGVLISICFIASVTASDSDALLKQVDKDLRQAERDMFGGKTEKAIASLENINISLQKIRKDDPDNPKLKTAENKYKKLVKDLERRTGKDLGGGTLTAATASTATEMAPKPEVKEATASSTQTSAGSAATAATGSAATSQATAEKTASSSKTAAKLPYDARKPMSETERNLSSLERDINKLADPDYGGNKDQLLSNMEKKLAQVKESLTEAKNFAAAKGVTSHPDFDAVESQIVVAEKEIGSAKSGHETNKAAAAASANEVEADVLELKAIYDQVDPVFSKAPGNVIYYNDLKTVEDVIVQIENFEKNDLASVQSKMKTFASKYGTTKAEIDKKADAMGFVDVYYRASYPYTELAVGIENVAKTRDVMAADLARRTQSELSTISKGAELHMIERYAKVRNWLAMAIRYKADNPKVVELQNTIDSQIETGMNEFNARVDGRNWPANASNAPSNADELADVSLDWFKDSPDWGKRSSKVRHPLAVTVTGPWSVQKRNLLGNPIMYGLPIKLAVLVDEDKELNVARVYELTMRTVEKADAKMEPPFDHITVGNSYFIRPDKVK